MSGTSLDGIDLAELQFFYSKDGNWTFDIITSETIAYPSNWKRALREAISYSEEKMELFDQEYTHYLSEVILEFINQHHIKDLDAVCSHGHTILHQPNNGVTLQIGNLPELATLINLKVVCDFRVQDVKLGGQGAPLVPIGDRLLFDEYDYCLNLGGFANISFEKISSNNDQEPKRIAYDVCPVNIVLNAFAEKLGFPYDEGGRLAASGNLDKKLFQKLNELSFYYKSPPKSLGLEWVQQHIFPILEASEASTIDILRTYTEHIAFQLVAQFSENSSVLITGGGVYNDFLITRLKDQSNAEVIIPSSGLPAGKVGLIEYKEALIFGLLGVLKLRDEINCLASVTGAKKDHSSGKIFKI